MSIGNLKERLMLLVWVILTLIFLKIASGETINESILMTINNSTDWRTNLSMCCNWMG